MNSFTDHPHRRFNPLTGEWVLVSPHRAKRPWQGQVEDDVLPQMLEHDPDCYLCARNTRINGAVNPDYKHTFVFENDFAALTPDAPAESFEDGLLKAEGESGVCRVICFSPRHDLTLARMAVDDIAKVVDTWVEQYQDLGAMPDINHVQIFENRGAMMGCSNPHPHGQIWASRSVPNEPAKETENQRAYYEKNGKPLLMAYLEQELAHRERILFENASFVVLVPYWAVWPFETMVLPKRHIRSMEEMTASERMDLAEAMSKTTIRYDNLFRTSFPYSMGFHQRPTDGEAHDEWVMHAHFYPPLLRSATVKKFMVGFELLGGPQRDLTAEQAADRLRGLADTHYLAG
ncbi:UDP-glucose--hexose-1-phosphate uridylyltransferase [Martelella endophytica]|uniref:Galactose-1-phosphate uridylyltransferase n=1 Tax=Martelella endophytica TaxID=1486262 RepID=A0A0D5LMR9_MAREN|nr:UDP-glucose--hexose-1-phosphate uridylyltransferase [Martelella endophytica]AJY45494.1 galactose-1-phosphate uridylyltransferase [Martelella endophytica]